MRIFAPIGPGKGMIALVIALIGGATLWAATARQPASAGKRPQRIVSLNLCADQLLVALADRDQIAGLTHNAADRQMSAVAAVTKGLPILDGSAEQILATNPDLVIGMPARRNPAIAILKAQHYPAVDLKSADSYADIVASIRTVAQAIGHADRGEAMIARMDRELAALPRNRGGKQHAVGVAGQTINQLRRRGIWQMLPHFQTLGQVKSAAKIEILCQICGMKLRRRNGKAAAIHIIAIHTRNILNTSLGPLAQPDPTSTAQIKNALRCQPRLHSRNQRLRRAARSGIDVVVELVRINMRHDCLLLFYAPTPA